MPTLPWSLSPHICVQSSSDLTDLLDASSLPPLPDILQSFSPLPQVVTRTTSLTSVTHPSFALRFSNLLDIEAAVQEDGDRRAARTLDWISARISHRAAKWVDDLDKQVEQGQQRAPWWDELRRCIHGDHTPVHNETWNHPAAIIFAVSTAAPNPLQAITNLQSRPVELPPWVDPNYLRCNLIVHPSNSPLSNEEVNALFNAVKKQFGLESFLLPLDLPSPPPPPVPVPAPMPRLPPPPADDSTEPPPVPITPMTPGFTPPTSNTPTQSTPSHSLRMIEKDIQQTAKFTRELVVMSLIPWMERCVTEWNENFSSTRRLPSRLFSSTRRLFGSASPSPTPTHAPSGSVGGLPSRSSTLPPGAANVAIGVPPPQQRRLAEFSTILGDYKLAITVWEALRKESRGGSDILPLLLSPSPTIPLHVSTALSSLHQSPSEMPPSALVRALTYATRWETGISPEDFLSSIYEGDRWLVWASGNSEEPPAAILLAHAAFLSLKKRSPRRAALWYASAAGRLEKSGMKPLTTYFLRRARELCNAHPEKFLSPSFWESEGKSSMSYEGFDSIIPGIEHPLGRLLYNTGDFAGAIKTFLGLLRESTSYTPYAIEGLPDSEEIILPGTDKAFVQDLQVALAHFKSIAGSSDFTAELQIPISFCQTRKTRLRLPRDMSHGSATIWEEREEQWLTFWRRNGKKDGLAKSGKAAVDETFWVDVVFQNPLHTDVTLNDLTLVAQSSDASSSSMDFLDIEVIETIKLGPKEARTVPFSIKSSKPASLTVSHVYYNFLGLLPSKESLAARGRRLHATPLQRQTPTYDPDIAVKVEIAEANHKLIANFVDDQRLILAQGEAKKMRLWLSNMGTRPIGEIWLVSGPDDILLVESQGEDITGALTSGAVTSNTLTEAQPYRIPLEILGETSSLLPGDNVELPVLTYAMDLGEHELQLLLVHRLDDSEPFHATRVVRPYEVTPSIDVTASFESSPRPDSHYLLNVGMENVSPSQSFRITHVSTISPTWATRVLHHSPHETISPMQSLFTTLSAEPWRDSSGTKETYEFVHSRIEAVLSGARIEEAVPPSLNLLWNSTSESHGLASSEQRLLDRAKAVISLRTLSSAHPCIPTSRLPSIFPVRHPFSVDFVVSWDIPGEGRSGSILVSGLLVGVGHGELQEIVETIEHAKVKRSMYAETQREKAEILAAIKRSEWNRDSNPAIVRIHEPRTMGHDFSSISSSSLCTPLEFNLRNHSLTRSLQFLLKLRSEDAPDGAAPNIFSPPYNGRLTFRGSLAPSESTQIYPKIRLTRPGTYSLAGWTLQVDVMESDGQRIRRRFSQSGPLDDRLTVYDSSS